jgi:peptidoglycan hydrolase-like protein with peptidoglycan-binding domain
LKPTSKTCKHSHRCSPSFAGNQQLKGSPFRRSSNLIYWMYQRNHQMAEPVLRKGSTEPAVRDLQEALKALGHDPGPVDGVFGATTEAAVKAFQQAKGIAVDGIVGRVTWINIDEADQSEPVLKIGSTGLPVRRAQKRMSLVGFEVGGVDGRYGTQTEAAVKQLQQQAGINVDGVVGPQTWSVIDALESEGPVS